MRTAEEWRKAGVVVYRRKITYSGGGGEAACWKKTNKRPEDVIEMIQSDVVEAAANLLACKAVFAESPELNKAYIECEQMVRGMIPGVKG